MTVSHILPSLLPDLPLFLLRVIPTRGMTLSDRHRLTQQLWDLAIAELTPAGVTIPPDAYEKERPKLPNQQPVPRPVPTVQLPSAL